MSIRRILVQQLGSVLRLPLADLDKLGEPFGSARFDGVERIYLNTGNRDRQIFAPMRGTCHADETDTVFCIYKGRGNRGNIVFGREFAIHVMECSECGRTYEHVNGDYEYCPHCGRRIMEVYE